MVSRGIISDVVMILVLVLLQVFLFNEVRLMGRYIPVVYTVFIFFSPFYRNQFVFLLMCFLLGLGVDSFLGTWGINAFACTSLGFFRGRIFRTSMDTSSETFSFDNMSMSSFLFYIFFSIVLHQLLVQGLEFFKWDRLPELLFSVLLTSVFSFAFVALYVFAFNIKQKI